jgi:DNA helicase-2/ATP-dependent DNA helicase PcrA
MRERLRRYIGATAYRVPIHTFHGFAGELIARFPESYQNVIGGKPASEIDKIKIFEQILDNPELKTIRTLKSPYHNLGKIKSIISKLKQEYVTPDRLANIVIEQEKALTDIEQFHEKGAHKGKERSEYRDALKDIDKNRELLLVYRQYETLLHEAKLFDYDDMLIETVTALQGDEDMRLEVQSTYQYVLADEHQDINGVQNQLLKELTSFHESPNIFAVGDEKQAIFRFQGASLENFLLFTNMYQDCVQISLTDNYRSGQAVLDAAQELIAVESGPLKELRIPLSSRTDFSATLERRIFSHEAVEDDWLVEKVQSELAAGTPADEIAVLVRNNYSVEQIAEKLRKAGITVAASAESDILEHPITRAVTTLIEVVAEPHNDEAWFTLIHAAHSGVPLGDIAALMQAKRFDQSLVACIENEIESPTLALRCPEALRNIIAYIEEARQLATDQGVHRVVEYLIERSGLLDHVVQNDLHTGTRVVRRLYDEIERLVVSGEVTNLSGLLRTFATYREYGIALTAPYIHTGESAVQVMSAHKSKGLEFEVVFLPRLIDKSWGGGKKSDYFNVPLAHYKIDTENERMADEERLLYVALTRAKKRLYLSHAETNIDGAESLPARLLEVFSDEHIAIIDTKQEEQSFDPVSNLGVVPNAAKLEPDVLFALFKEKGFSATSLNNYLASPYTFLYQNLLLIPHVQTIPLQFGSVVHDVLERVANEYTASGSIVNTAAIKKWIELRLQRLPLSQNEYIRMHEHALDAIEGYIREVSTAWPTVMESEKKFTVEMNTGVAECPTVRLTGKFDRIDFDDNGRAVAVIDYKTGKPKSRNDIEGKTKTSDGNYKRQLVFYALLLELQEEARFKTRTMKLSFVEPNSSGKYKEESFEITDQEVDALKAEIVSVVKDLASGSAWNTVCDSEKCAYCHLLPK